MHEKMTKKRRPHVPGKKCRRCGKDLKGLNCYSKRVYCSQACMGASYRAGPAEFWEKVDKTSHPGGCWLYTGFTKWDGYGWLARNSNGKTRYMTAHRYAWILTNGDVPLGLHVLHRCDNPPCCNPAHLWLGTHQDNMRDKTAKGRFGTLFPDRVRPVKQPA